MTKKKFLKVVQNHLKRKKTQKKFHFFPFTDLGCNGNRAWT